MELFLGKRKTKTKIRDDPGGKEESWRKGKSFNQGSLNQGIFQKKQK